MRVRQVAAEQAHYVPPGPRSPHGPFPPELFREPEIVYDYVPQPDDGGDPVPEGGTAQNGFRALQWYRCRFCLEAVREDELDAHWCEEGEA